MRPRTNTEHGQYGFARREKCKCEPCLIAKRKYYKRREYDATTGNNRTVPADPVRQHLQPMWDAEISAIQIAKATGGKVRPTQVRRLMTKNWDGKQVQRLYRKTAEALMAVEFYEASVQKYVYVSVVPTRRRIQALQWMGWPISELAPQLGVVFGSVYSWLREDRITTETERLVKDLYERLQYKAGPSEREKYIAYRRGYLPPAAWEDDQALDDPYGLPDLRHLGCVVCLRPVHANSLCEKHWWVVEKAGKWEGRTFRPFVENLIRKEPRRREAA